MATASRKSPSAELAALLKRHGLIGVSAASRLLGIKPSNFSRDARPHLTEIPVEGSAAVFLRSEVQRLARTRHSRNGH